MKKPLLILTVMAFAVNVFAQQDINLGIIPAPQSVVEKEGKFILDKTVVLVSADPKNAAIADMLNAFIVNRGGFALRTAKTINPGQKSLVLSSADTDKLGDEAYKIQISGNQVILTGRGAGLFYAVQSLQQMMPERKNDQIQLPAVSITDEPRFKYRGTHLDVARHFFPVSFIKKYIDLLAMYKINNFHWHLTEDQGWRIEIKKYPKLTSVGSVRNGTIIGNYPGTGGTDNEVYKGFYTQDEVKDVVAYAARKFINVVPEIEMPGHASAAIAAYS